MFCILEKDEKTYQLTQKVVDYIRKDIATRLFEFDNEVQKKEITVHLYLNGCREFDQDEKLKWIRSYGKDFRTYLNTIKIAAMVWCFQSEGKEFDETEFLALVEFIIRTKACLDNIHN